MKLEFGEGSFMNEDLDNDQIRNESDDALQKRSQIVVVHESNCTQETDQNAIVNSKQDSQQCYDYRMLQSDQYVKIVNQSQKSSQDNNALDLNDSRSLLGPTQLDFFIAMKGHEDDEDEDLRDISNLISRQGDYQIAQTPTLEVRNKSINSISNNEVVIEPYQHTNRDRGHSPSLLLGSISSTQDLMRKQGYSFMYTQSLVSQDNNDIHHHQGQIEVNVAKKTATMSRNLSSVYFSQRDNTMKASQFLSINTPKDKKISLDVLLDSDLKQKQKDQAILNRKLDRIMDILSIQPDGDKIISNLKIIFLEYSQFNEGTISKESLTQQRTVNQNMMGMYSFHQFMKTYGIVKDVQQSSHFENIFLVYSSQTHKKICFSKFLTVLTKVSMLLYNNNDQLQCLMLLLEDYIFNRTQPSHQYNSVKEGTKRDSSPISEIVKMGQQATCNEFEQYKMEYESSIVLRIMNKNRTLIDKIFTAFAISSKKGQKVIPLKQYKSRMRELGIVPSIATEYKCIQVFKYFDLCTQHPYQDESMTIHNFSVSVYILFSIALEDDTDIDKKVTFILQWLKEHSRRNKGTVPQQIKEQQRIQATNAIFSKH